MRLSRQHKWWVLGAVSVLAGIWLLSSSRGFSASDLMEPKEPKNPVVALPRPGDVSGRSSRAAKSESTIIQPSGHVTFVQALVQCSPSTPASTPQELFAQLSQAGESSHDVALENWHLRRSDGSEERLMLIPSDKTDAEGKKEVRWFTVDDEGLPVPQKLPWQKAFNPSAEFLDELKSRGEIFFHQAKQQIIYKNQISANVELINDKIQEFQVYFPDKTLSCRGDRCQCR